MKAIVLAGGYGSRVMPMTHYVPKPMLPVAGRPVIDYAVSRLVAAGITDITFALGYKPEQIEAHVAGYADIRPTFVREDAPLGTAGSVRRALGDGDEFVVLSADTVCNADLRRLVSAFRESGGTAAMEVTTVPDLAAYGAVEEHRGFVTGLREKDAALSHRAGMANAGAYVLSRRALELIPEGVPFDFARDLFPLLLSRGETVVACELRGYWKDVGSIGDYYRANFDVLRMPFPRARHARRLTEHYAGDSLVMGTAVVSGRIRRCIVCEGARVTSHASLEDCIVLPGELVERRASGEIIGGAFVLDPRTGNANLLNLRNSSKFFRLFA